MTNSVGFFLLQLRLEVTAGYFGTFPEPELLLWLRAEERGSGKLLVIEPVESLESSLEGTRNFSAREYSVDHLVVTDLVSMLEVLKFTDRCVGIEDTGDPESIWWAGVTLDVSLDSLSRTLRFDMGPTGICGPDAAAIKSLLRVVFALCHVESRWSKLLTGREQDSD